MGEGESRIRGCPRDSRTCLCQLMQYLAVPDESKTMGGAGAFCALAVLALFNLDVASLGDGVHWSLLDQLAL
jgi:hypothetical protein